MAVPAGPTEKRYTGNGVTKIFSIPFLLIAATDLDVIIDGVEVVSGYAITGAGNPSSTITFVTAPADQSSILLTLNVPFERLNDYQENGDFLASTVNRDFDKIWQALKQLVRYSTRALTLGAFDVDGAGLYRAKGNGIANLGSANGVDTAAANWKDVKDQIALVLATGQGPINNAANMAYITPSSNVRTVQGMSGADGSYFIGHGDTTVGAEIVAIDAQLQAQAGQISKTGIYPGQHFAAINGGQLNKLRLALTDPFMQYLGICIIGDSITWGMTASGIAPIEPRGGSLTDSRNNGSSATWVNLLHKWLGAEYYDSTTVEEGIWPGTPNGVAQFTYTKAVDMFPGFAPFVKVGSFSQLVDAASTLGVFWFVNMSSSGSGPHSFTWTMTGKSFDLRFAAVPMGQITRYYVDGVLQGQYKTSSTDLGIPVSYRNSRTHDFTFKKGAVIRVEAVGGNVARDVLQVESIRLNRKVRVTNQGIIGVASDRYLNVLLSSALRADDSFCKIQIGTNDRGMPPAIGAPTSPATLSKNMGLILDYVIAAGVSPIMMCANEVVDNSLPTYYYSMGQVRTVLSSLAISRGVDFIDQFALTKRLQAAGVNYLADGLHPNDLGHFLMFENIRNAIGNPVFVAEKSLANYYETTVSWTAGAVQTITHNLGAIPVRVEFEVVMKTAGAGMAVGQSAMTSMTIQAAASYNAMARSGTTTTVEVVVAPQGLAVLVAGGSSVLSPAQADLKVKVFT